MSKLPELFFTGPAAAGGRSQQTFTSGQLLAWNPGTGQNTVRVDNVDYTNLPLVDPSELVVGVRVLLIFPTSGCVPILVGRLFVPAP